MARIKVSKALLAQRFALEGLYPRYLVREHGVREIARAELPSLAIRLRAFYVAAVGAPTLAILLAYLYPGRPLLSTKFGLLWVGGALLLALLFSFQISHYVARFAYAFSQRVRGD